MINEPKYNYSCEKLGLRCIQSPCEKNLLKIKEHRLKSTHALLSIPLEHCEKCGGRDLITLNLGGEFVDNNKMTPAVARDMGKKPPKKEELSPELPQITEKFIEETSLELEQRLLSPKQEETYQQIMVEQEEIVPAVKISESETEHIRRTEAMLLDSGKQEEIVPAVKLTEQEAVKLGIVAPAPPPEARYCPAHPEVLQRVDKLGRWMGMCDECLSTRGKKCGEQNIERGTTAPPVFIPLNLPKYAELKAWLEAQAEEGERKLMQQIMFILKMAWRQGL